jgi:hypothetical protein
MTETTDQTAAALAEQRDLRPDSRAPSVRVVLTASIWPDEDEAVLQRLIGEEMAAADVKIMFRN